MPRATRATDAPSTNVSSTIRRFSAMLRRCLLGAPNDSLLAVLTSENCREVSISAPGGHLFIVSTSRRMTAHYPPVQTVTTGRLLSKDAKSQTKLIHGMHLVLLFSPGIT